MVSVGVAVLVAVAVTVEMGVLVSVGVAVPVAVGVLVSVGVAVAVAVGVLVSVGVAVAVAVGVLVGVIVTVRSTSHKSPLLVQVAESGPLVTASALWMRKEMVSPGSAPSSSDVPGSSR